MTPIVVRPVQDRQDRHVFLTFPWRIYYNDPLWVPPILSERRNALDPRKGVFFQRGEAESFIAWRDGKPVGTICCAEDFSAHAAHPWKDALIGFFECLPEYAISQALFDHASQWAARRGLHALYGPFNLDYEDSYGLLVEGRDRPPAILCGHTHAEYPALFERYGFTQARGEALAFALDLDLQSPAVQRLLRLADRVAERGHYRVRTANLQDWEAEIERVYSLINRALQHLPGHIPWQRVAVEALLAPFKRLVDPKLVLFAETPLGEPVGFFPGIPNWNETLIHVNGLRYPWNQLQLLWRSRQRPDCLSIKSVLVPPEYWDTGVAVLLFAEMARRASGQGYRWIDLSLTSDDNPRTPLLARHFGAQCYKRYRVYRKWLAQAPAP